MRRVPFAWLPVASLALLPACSDDVVVPLSATWLEWSDSVAAGVPFGVRVSGLMSGHPTSLRVRVRFDRDTVTIQPYSVEPPCRGNCPGILFGYDTLVWVPALAATTPRPIVLRAPYTDVVDPTSWPVRTFGTLTVSPTAPLSPLIVHAAGKGLGSYDAAGCYYVLSPSRKYISADQPPPWAPGFSGFAYGRVDPVLRSVCLDDAYVIQVDSIR